MYISGKLNKKNSGAEYTNNRVPYPSKTTRVNILKDEIKVLLVNARSVRNKFDELKCLVTAEQLHILCITETFLDHTNIDLPSEYQIDSYKLFYKDRIGRRGGGVAIYV